ncbi:MAG: molecular chaperone DnaJ, partial [Oscillospiraceae bacterium]|nr:molecular chaperone DnaJ [Oscillospiraceae bacterium]
KYTLPAGTQPGTTFRLRGKGIPELRGRGRGDQYVTVQVQVPTSLTSQQREALQAFAEAMGETVPASSSSPVKDFFEKKRKKK